MPHSEVIESFGRRVKVILLILPIGKKKFGFVTKMLISFKHV